MKYGLGQTVAKLAALAVVLIAAGGYLISHPDPDRPNLAAIAGTGIVLVGAVLLAMAVAWTARSRRRVGQPRIIEVDTGSGQDQSAVLEIARPVAGATDFVRTYQVRLDGATVGSLKIGDVLRVTTRAGSHSVQIQMDQFDSAVTTVELSSGSAQRWDVTPTSGSPAERRAGHWLELVPET